MFIPASCAQVNLIFGGNGAPKGAQMTFGVGATEVDDPVEIAEHVRDALEASNFLANSTSELYIQTILVKRGPNETGPSAELGVQIFGETSGNAVPPQVSVLVRKSTVQGGRKGQGRYFMPGIPESAVSAAGILSQQYVSDIQVTQDAFKQELADSLMPMLLLHSVEGSSDLPLAITKLTVQSKVATQRRRLR
jgi:hypothetical protein